MKTAAFVIPGWGLGRGPLNATVDALQGQFLDLPGYGGTALISDFDAAIDQLAGQLPDQAALIGWSLGAQVALAIAARYPGKIARLVLIAGTPAFIQHTDWPPALPPAALAEFRASIAQDAAAALPRFVSNFNRGDAQAKKATRELLALADPLPSTDTLLCGLDWLRDIDLRAAMPAIHTTTLLIHGAMDPLMPLAAAQALQAQMPRARLTSLDRSAHAPFISQAEACHSALRAFLNEQA